MFSLAVHTVIRNEFEIIAIQEKALISISGNKLREVLFSYLQVYVECGGFYFSYLEDVGSAGENATEFFNLYFELMKPAKWKSYLARSGALLTIGNLVTKVSLVLNFSFCHKSGSIQHSPY